MYGAVNRTSRNDGVANVSISATRWLAAKWPNWASSAWVATRSPSAPPDRFRLSTPCVNSGRRAAISGGTLHVTAGVHDVITGRKLQVDTPAHVVLDRGVAEHITFHANAGDTFAFAVNSVATTPQGQNARYIVYRPDAGAIGSVTPSYTEFGANGPRLLDLPYLPVTGDYTIAVVSDNAVGIDTTVQLISGEVGSLPADGQSSHFQTRGSQQSTYVDFTAYQGESLELTFWNTVQTGASYPAYVVDIRDAAGRYMGGTGCYVNDPGCVFHLWNLPAGSYRATVSANWGGTLSFDAAARPHKILPTLTSDASVAVSLGRGEAGRVTFHANAGDTLALVESGIKTDPVGRNVRFLLYRPDAGTLVATTVPYTEFSRSGDQLLDLPNLPVSGDYTLVVLPDYSVPADVTLTLVGGATGALLGDGATHTFETNASTQTTYFSFTANRGDNLELAFSNVVQSGASYPAYSVDIRDDAGRDITYNTCYSSDPGCTFHLWALSGGTYRVTVSLLWGGTLRFNAAVVPHRTGRVLAFDTPASFDLGTGQVERLTVHANAGDTIALQETGIVTTPAGQNVRFLLYRPDAGVITTSTPAYLDFTRSGNQVADLPNLPATGDYTLLVIPSSGVAAHVRLDLLHGATATLVADAPSQTLHVPGPGQTTYLKFHARALDDLELSFTNASAVGALYGNYNIYVSNALGQQVGGTSCYYGDPGCVLHLWYLPEGDYQVNVVMNNGQATQFDARLTSQKKGAHLSDGDDLDINLGAGQTERVTFDATAGDTRTLLMKDVLTGPAGGNVRLMVYAPNTGITTSTSAIFNDASNGNRLFTLANLPVTGTYTVLVVPDYGLPASLTLTEAFVRAADTPAPKPVNLTVDAAPKHFGWTLPDPPVSMVFNSTGGPNLDVAITGAAGTDSYYFANVYDPSGAYVGSSQCYTTTAVCTVDVWNTHPGTYSITLATNTGSGMSFDAVVHSNPNGGALERGVTKAVTADVGDVVRYTFDAVQGETLALYLSDIVVTAPGQNLGIRVYRPDGGLIQPGFPWSSVVTNTRTTININSAPVTGRYTVLVHADWLLSFNAKLLLAPGTTGSVIAPEQTTHIEANAPGENAWFDIDAGNGGNFELFLSNLNLQDGNNYVALAIYNAAGATIDSFNCYPSDPSCSRDMWNLAPGTYRVAVIPQYGTSKPTFDATFIRNKEKGKLVRGTPSDITHVGGDILRYTFDASQGETIGLTLSGIATTPGGRNSSIRVYRPDGGLILPGSPYSSMSTTSVNTLNLTNLPATGTYTVLVNSDYLIAGSGQLTLVGAASGSTLTEAASLHGGAKAPGQSIYFDMDIGSGGAYELALSGVSSGDGGDSYYTVSLFSPAGAQVDAFNCYPSYPGCTRDLWNMAPGRYHVVVQPAYPSSTMSFDALIRANPIKGALTRNTPADITHQFGDLLRYTFQATTGETVAIRIDNPTTTPAAYNTGARVYRPDGGLITGNSTYSSMNGRDSQTLNLPSLPSTGTYTVLVNSDYLVAGTGTLTVADGVTGHTLTDGLVTHLDAGVAAQNLYFDVDLRSGANAELLLYGVTQSDGGDNYYTVTIYSPNGVQVDSYTCYPSWPSCPRDLWELPAGIYHVTVQPAYAGQRLSFDGLLKTNALKGALVPGVPADMAHGIGDLYRYTFTANAGGTVALRLSSVVTTPAGFNTSVRVYRPDGGRITTNGYYAQTGTRDNTLINLPDLPVGGVYTVIVNSDYDIGGTGSLTLVPGVQGIDISGGSAVHARANAPGQNIYMDVDVPTAGNFELTLAGTAQDPMIAYMSVALLNAAGAQVDSYTCYTTSNCARDYWNLAAGHYRVVASPADSRDIAGFDARFLPNVDGGTLTRDVPVDITRRLGEDTRFTFTAHRKDSVGIRVAGATTSPAGGTTYVRVYRPDGGLITPDNRYAILGTYGSDTLNLPNLPVDGTYTVVVNSDNLSAGQGSLTLTQGTTP